MTWMKLLPRDTHTCSTTLPTQHLALQPPSGHYRTCKCLALPNIRKPGRFLLEWHSPHAFQTRKAVISIRVSGTEHPPRQSLTELSPASNGSANSWTSHSVRRKCLWRATDAANTSRRTLVPLQLVEIGWEVFTLLQGNRHIMLPVIRVANCSHTEAAKMFGEMSSVKPLE